MVMWLKRNTRELTADERTELDEYRRRFGPLRPLSKHISDPDETKHISAPQQTKKRGG